jgi:hypothetical protein
MRFCTPPKNDRLPLLIAAAFLVVGGFVMAHHELWRDEVQAWLLARDSSLAIDLGGGIDDDAWCPSNSGPAVVSLTSLCRHVVPAPCRFVRAGVDSCAPFRIVLPSADCYGAGGYAVAGPSERGVVYGGQITVRLKSENRTPHRSTSRRT